MFNFFNFLIFIIVELPEQKKKKLIEENEKIKSEIWFFNFEFILVKMQKTQIPSFIRNKKIKHNNSSNPWKSSQIIYCGK